MPDSDDVIKEELEELSDRDLERYDRQIRLFEEEGQKKLKNSTVAVVGLGGLGSPASYYLAAAGVGKLLIIDPDEVDISNLNRQILHWEDDVDGKSKTESAKQKLEKLNSDIDVYVLDGKIQEESVEKLKGVDVIVDGLDNFETRYLINEFAVEEDIPFVHAAVEGSHGQLTTIIPGESPCLECIFPEPPESSDVFPILGTTAGLFGVMLANEAIKIITGYGEPLVGQLFVFDLDTNNVDILDIAQDSDCPVCGESEG